MSETATAPAASKPKELPAARPAIPAWNAPAPTDPRKLYVRERRQARRAQAEYDIAQLEAGPKQYKVALFGEKNGPQLRVMRLGVSVDHLIVGATSPDEAKGKFARYNGIAGGFENIRILDGPTS